MWTSCLEMQLMLSMYQTLGREYKNISHFWETIPGHPENIEKTVTNFSLAFFSSLRTGSDGGPLGKLPYPTYGENFTLNDLSHGVTIIHKYADADIDGNVSKREVYDYFHGISFFADSLARKKVLPIETISFNMHMELWSEWWGETS